ncbi:hypothetical protein [Amycolatopsis benzoatilytica]|uniref:hypothetical protein n=1 Tax=Amycolatopsis benzoatilytica TaxID=346045 RepID=UPI00036C0F18|nr:hypothetical protein [Amycolatopsis benzoatilytica]
MTAEAQLPVLDEHRITVPADAETAWRALTETVAGMSAGRLATAYAWAVRCADWKASGSGPLVVGATIPGFRVLAADPPERLVLAGRHLFSEYQLAFRLESRGGETLIRAESRAVFPGLTGGGYRLLVVGTGGHVIGMRMLLRKIARRA